MILIAVDRARPGTAVRSVPPYWWFLPVVTGVGLAVAYVLPGPGSDVAWILAPLGPFVAAVVAVRYRTMARGPAIAIAVALGLFMARKVGAAFIAPPHPGAAVVNILSVIGYFALAGGLTALGWRASRKKLRRALNPEAALDSALVTTGAAACLLTWLTLPALSSGPMTTVRLIVMVIFPVLDLVIIASAVYISFVSGPGLVARWWLLSAAGSLFVFDLLRAVPVTGNQTVLPAAGATLIFAYACIGAMVLHPTATRLGERTRLTGQPWGVWRLTILAIGLLAPIALIVLSPSHDPQFALVLLISNVISTALLFTRGVLAVRAYSEAHSTMRTQAEKDTLTGLANRPAFRAHVVAVLTVAEEDRRTVSVLFIDLNGFKSINDTLGHAAGDALLRQVAQRMQLLSRTDDFPTRLGGDEFALATLDDDIGSVGERLAGRMQHLFDPPFALDGSRLEVRAAVGLANSAEAGLSSVDALVAAADSAMYSAKRAGSRSWVRFTGRPGSTVGSTLGASANTRRADAPSPVTDSAGLSERA